MKTLALVAAITVWPLHASAQPQERWLCIADHSTGFSFNASSKTWGPARFHVTDSRFVIQRPTTNVGASARSKWVVTKIGDRTPDSYCASDFADDVLTCRGIQIFSFSRVTLRFQKVYEIGYVSPTETEGGDTPSITIGKCSPL